MRGITHSFYEQILEKKLSCNIIKRAISFYMKIICNVKTNILDVLFFFFFF